MRKSHLVILPGARSLTQMGALLLFLACPNIAFVGRDRQDIQPACSFSTMNLKWLQKKPESVFLDIMSQEPLGAATDHGMETVYKWNKFGNKYISTTCNGNETNHPKIGDYINLANNLGTTMFGNQSAKCTNYLISSPLQRNDHKLFHGQLITHSPISGTSHSKSRYTSVDDRRPTSVPVKETMVMPVRFMESFRFENKYPRDTSRISTSERKTPQRIENRVDNRLSSTDRQDLIRNKARWERNELRSSTLSKERRTHLSRDMRREEFRDDSRLRPTVQNLRHSSRTYLHRDNIEQLRDKREFRSKRNARVQYDTRMPLDSRDYKSTEKRDNIGITDERRQTDSLNTRRSTDLRLSTNERRNNLLHNQRRSVQSFRDENRLRNNERRDIRSQRYDNMSFRENTKIQQNKRLLILHLSDKRDTRESIRGPTENKRELVTPHRIGNRVENRLSSNERQESFSNTARVERNKLRSTPDERRTHLYRELHTESVRADSRLHPSGSRVTRVQRYENLFRDDTNLGLNTRISNPHRFDIGNAHISENRREVEPSRRIENRANTRLFSTKRLDLQRNTPRLERNEFRIYGNEIRVRRESARGDSKLLSSRRDIRSDRHDNLAFRDDNKLHQGSRILNSHMTNQRDARVPDRRTSENKREFETLQGIENRFGNRHSSIERLDLIRNNARLQRNELRSTSEERRTHLPRDVRRESVRDSPRIQTSEHRNSRSERYDALSFRDDTELKPNSKILISPLFDRKDDRLWTRRVSENKRETEAPGKIENRADGRLLSTERMDLMRNNPRVVTNERLLRNKRRAHLTRDIVRESVRDDLRLQRNARQGIRSERYNNHAFRDDTNLQQHSRILSSSVTDKRDTRESVQRSSEKRKEFDISKRTENGNDNRPSSTELVDFIRSNARLEINELRSFPHERRTQLSREVRGEEFRDNSRLHRSAHRDSRLERNENLAFHDDTKLQRSRILNSHLTGKRNTRILARRSSVNRREFESPNRIENRFGYRSLFTERLDLMRNNARLERNELRSTPDARGTQLFRYVRGENVRDSRFQRSARRDTRSERYENFAFRDDTNLQQDSRILNSHLIDKSNSQVSPTRSSEIRSEFVDARKIENRSHSRLSFPERLDIIRSNARLERNGLRFTPEEQRKRSSRDLSGESVRDDSRILISERRITQSERYNQLLFRDNTDLGQRIRVLNSHISDRKDSRLSLRRALENRREVETITNIENSADNRRLSTERQKLIRTNAWLGRIDLRVNPDEHQKPFSRDLRSESLRRYSMNHSSERRDTRSKKYKNSAVREDAKLQRDSTISSSYMSDQRNVPLSSRRSLEDRREARAFKGIENQLHRTLSTAKRFDLFQNNDRPERNDRWITADERRKQIARDVSKESVRDNSRFVASERRNNHSKRNENLFLHDDSNVIKDSRILKSHLYDNRNGRVSARRSTENRRVVDTLQRIENRFSNRHLSTERQDLIRENARLQRNELRRTPEERRTHLSRDARRDMQTAGSIKNRADGRLLSTEHLDLMRNNIRLVENERLSRYERRVHLSLNLCRGTVRDDSQLLISGRRESRSERYDILAFRDDTKLQRNYRILNAHMADKRYTLVSARPSSEGRRKFETPEQIENRFRNRPLSTERLDLIRNNARLEINELRTSPDEHRTQLSREVRREEFRDNSRHQRSAHRDSRSERYENLAFRDDTKLQQRSRIHQTGKRDTRILARRSSVNRREFKTSQLIKNRIDHRHSISERLDLIHNTARLERNELRCIRDERRTCHAREIRREFVRDYSRIQTSERRDTRSMRYYSPSSRDNTELHLDLKLLNTRLYSRRLSENRRKLEGPRNIDNSMQIRLLLADRLDLTRNGQKYNRNTILPDVIRAISKAFVRDDGRLQRNGQRNTRDWNDGLTFRKEFAHYSPREVSRKAASFSDDRQQQEGSQRFQDGRNSRLSFRQDTRGKLISRLTYSPMSQDRKLFAESSSPNRHLIARRWEIDLINVQSKFQSITNSRVLYEEGKERFSELRHNYLSRSSDIPRTASLIPNLHRESTRYNFRFQRNERTTQYNRIGMRGWSRHLTQRMKEIGLFDTRKREFTADKNLPSNLYRERFTDVFRSDFSRRINLFRDDLMLPDQLVSPAERRLRLVMRDDTQLQLGSRIANTRLSYSKRTIEPILYSLFRLSGNPKRTNLLNSQRNIEIRAHNKHLTDRSELSQIIYTYRHNDRIQSRVYLSDRNLGHNFRYDTSRQNYRDDSLQLRRKSEPRFSRLSSIETPPTQERLYSSTRRLPSQVFKAFGTRRGINNIRTNDLLLSQNVAFAKKAESMDLPTLFQVLGTLILAFLMANQNSKNANDKDSVENSYLKHTV